MSGAIAPRSERTRLGIALDRGDREVQEDAVGVIGGDDPAFESHGGVLGVVCDGMGGMQYGAEASKMALAAFTAAYRNKPPSESIPDALRRAANKANESVYSAAAAANVPGRMGCTLAAFVIRGIEFYWVYAGDSRIYHLSAGRLVQVSGDHNYGAVLDSQVASGEMLALDAANHPKREALTSHLGRAEIPILDGAASPVRLLPGDWILACSDGLYSVLADTTIQRMLIGSPNAAAIALINAVRESPQGDKDNASVVVANLTDRQVTVARYDAYGAGGFVAPDKSSANRLNDVQSARARIGANSPLSWPVVSLGALSICLACVIGWMSLGASNEPGRTTINRLDTRVTESSAPLPTSPALGQVYVGEALPAVSGRKPPTNAPVDQRTSSPEPATLAKRSHAAESSNSSEGSAQKPKLTASDGAKATTAPKQGVSGTALTGSGTVSDTTVPPSGAQGTQPTTSQTPVDPKLTAPATPLTPSTGGSPPANAAQAPEVRKSTESVPSKGAPDSNTTPAEKGGAQ